MAIYRLPIIFLFSHMYRETFHCRQLLHASLIRFLPAGLLITGISLSGCVSTQSSHTNVSDATTATVHRKSAMSRQDRRTAIPVPEKIPAVKVYQHEIARLKQLLAEKEKIIQSKTTGEQGSIQTQGQASPESKNSVSQTKSQQYRLATKPEAASKIAEVEVSLGMLKQSAARHDPTLLSLAQSFLDAALQKYEQGDFGGAMSYAMQSDEGIAMISRLADKSYEQQPASVILRTPLFLQTRQEESLKIAPDRNAETQSILAMNTAVNATAYHGRWLRIETRDGRSGWIENRSVDARINLPDQE